MIMYVIMYHGILIHEFKEEMSMKLFKKSVVVLTVISMMFSSTLLASAKQSDSDYITYNEYKAAVINEYSKLGFDISFTDPEVTEITITKDMLEKRLQQINEEIKEAQLNNSQQTLIQPNSIQPRNMPYDKTSYFNRQIIAPTAVYGYGNWDIKINFSGNAQYGTVIGINSIDVKQIGYSLNLSNWSYNGYSHTSWGSNVDVYLYMTTTFSWSDPYGGTISHTSEHTLTCQLYG